MIVLQEMIDMKFRVYELGTDKDVTDENEWYIDTDTY